ncbi:hypothetical protein [Nonomuraea sp. NPDC049028]|uniref:hypothetical protein n=1 Tax=Nonomuraea sp. NPDC049028 TaxID=3364348 RepID=UPI0037214B78
MAVKDEEARKLVATSSTKHLCDMYINATEYRKASTEDEARVVSRTIGWIVEELETRDPDASRSWCKAEEAVEIDMLSRDEWIDGAAELAPHAFFGFDTPSS